jgi:hypothetical protein
VTRIVYYRLPEAALFALEPYDRRMVEHWSCDASTLCSRPKVLRAEEDLDLITLGCERVDLTDQYRIGWTTAPESYDGGSTLTVRSEGGRRLVAVRLDDLEWQENRYLSGLYGRLEVAS